MIITKKSKKRILLSIIGTIAIIFSHFFISAVTDIHIVAKPMIYIYPEEDNTELVMKLENKDLLTTTYPKYKEGWDIIVNKDGNIYDKNTSRNYYGLYWEGKDNSKINTKEGFVVSGENTTKFLEEKLEILGLNEREINEFIIYWLPKMEHNKYNYIRFRTTEEINQYMPITVNHKIDTLIRVNMDFKPLNKKITIKEQKLTKVERKGFTIVEWGGTEIN